MQIDDSFLLTLAEVAKRGLNLSIVLSVGGATIEGTIISEEEYYERLSELVESASPEQAEQAEHLREYLRRAPSTYDETAMTYLDEGGDPETARGLREALSRPFIHLRDTRILLPSGKYVDMAAPWRGKQSAIDGYWLEGIIS
jgi:hypothetical protein